jgi:hypothetical protein
MNPRHIVTLLSSACCACLLSGCAGAAGQRAPQDSTRFTVDNTERFAALDAATQEEISCTGLQERTLGDGRLEVVASIRNRAEKAARILVHCSFIDSRGMPLGDDPWQPLSIGADSTEVARFTAPSLASVRYEIRVRSAR